MHFTQYDDAIEFAREKVSDQVEVLFWDEKYKYVTIGRYWEYCKFVRI
jgi:hypothetical protein